MADNIQKIKAWYEKMHVSQVSYEKSGIKPTKDWRILLGVTCMMLCLLAVLAFYFYTSVNNGSFFTTSQDGVMNEVKINESLFNKTIDNINTREMLLNSIKQGRQTPADPSV